MTAFTATKKGNRVSLGSAFEDRLAFSRGVRAGDTVYVSGTTATDNEGKLLASDMYGQMTIIYQKIEPVLQAFGASMRDVVKENIYLKDHSDMDGLLRAHKEAFANILPVSTGVEVGFPDTSTLVEIDVIAVVGNLDQG